MLSRLRKRMKGEKGFTLIELLVVIIIIAILAAIAIPTFLGQRQKAYDAAAKSLVRNAMTSMESYYVDTRDFSTVTAGDLSAIEPTITWNQEANAATAATSEASGNEVSYTVNTAVVSTTAGADGTLGTADDVVTNVPASADTYMLGSLSQSGWVWGVEVDKQSGPITYERTDADGNTTAGW